MPTSIGHALGGYAALKATGTSAHPKGHNGWALFFLAVVVANLPDLDFVPGILLGNSNTFHRAASHSLLATLLVPALIAVVWRLRTRHFWAPFTACVVAYGSHVLLDTIVPDPLGSGGVRLLWPITDNHYRFFVPGLEILNPLRYMDPEGFSASLFAEIFSWHGLRVFIVDALMVLPLVPLGVWISRRREGPSGA
jgi:membrane-bound metal-dependent hydrolase YbcI (DUF457 family)